jgi:Domain of unknown function (DUF2760)
VFHGTSFQEVIEMETTPMALPARLWLALVCFFRVIGDQGFAALVEQARLFGTLPAHEPGWPAAALPAAPVAAGKVAASAAPAAAPAPAVDLATARDGSLQILALLQREARLLDFCEEELTGYSDATIGAAARTVHAGCKKALNSWFELLPVRAEKEGATVTVEKGFDARAIRLTGNIVGNPPFSGALRHHGWRVSAVKLPEPARGEAAAILAPAEVELL